MESATGAPAWEEKLTTRGMQIILDLFALAGCWNLLELLIYCIRRG